MLLRFQNTDDILIDWIKENLKLDERNNNNFNGSSHRTYIPYAVV